MLLAILLDQRIRLEGALRAVFLYPLALSQIVAGTAWQWLLNPGFGIEKSVQNIGWTSFKFGWLGNPDLAIFCVALAAVWQCAGFVAALFLAGLRGIDDEIVKAAQVDGATMPTIYRRIIIPVLRPVFFSVLLILAHLAIKTFDLIVAMTAGGPGTSTWTPSIFMYTFAFGRGRMGLGAASAMMMLAMVVAVLVPLMYLRRAGRRAMRHDPKLARITIYALLTPFALFFLTPIYVVVARRSRRSTSCAAATCLALPEIWSAAAWLKAWSTACTGTACNGLWPFFINSVLMVICLGRPFGADRDRSTATCWRSGTFAARTRSSRCCCSASSFPIRPFCCRPRSFLRIARTVEHHCGAGDHPCRLRHRLYDDAVSEFLRQRSARSWSSGGASMAPAFLIYRRIFLPLSAPIVTVCVIWQFTQI